MSKRAVRGTPTAAPFAAGTVHDRRQLAACIQIVAHHAVHVALRTAFALRYCLVCEAVLAELHDAQAFRRACWDGVANPSATLPELDRRVCPDDPNQLRIPGRLVGDVKLTPAEAYCYLQRGFFAYCFREVLQHETQARASPRGGRHE